MNKAGLGSRVLQAGIFLSAGGLALVGACLLTAKGGTVSGAGIIGAALCLALAGLNEHLRPLVVNRYFAAMDTPSMPGSQRSDVPPKDSPPAVRRLLMATPARTLLQPRYKQLTFQFTTPRVGSRELAPVDARPRVDAIVLVFLTVIAAVPRLWALGDVPAGLHGDEALTGLDALRIQSEGWIGPYVGSALGQPSGPLYWAAFVLAFTEDTAYTLRLSMALLGIVTVPVTYLAARQLFSREVGVIAALLLAFMAWHLTFSRIAFMVISWPLMEMAVVVLLFTALRHQRLILFCLAGVALGLGIYTYNVYPFFVIAVALFAALFVLLSQSPRRELMNFTAMGATAALVAAPMFYYIAHPSNDYFAHHRAFSIFHSEPFLRGDFLSRTEILIEQGWKWLTSIFWSSTPNAAEGTGGDPALDLLTVALVVLGLAMCVKNRNKPSYQFLVIVLLVIPIGSVISVDPGFRRSLGNAPFIAIISALPLAYLWQRSFHYQGVKIAARSAVFLVICVFALINLNGYRAMATTESSDWVYAEEMAEASKYLAHLPGQPYVYFFSARWGYNYETRRFLAPGLEGEDRADVSQEEQRYAIERWRDSVFVLLPPYLDELPAIQALYPGGEVYIGDDSGQQLFIGYRVPADPSAAPPPDIPSIPDAPIDGDEERLADLARLAEVLEEHKASTGEYPNTQDQVQSACVYRELDVLCQFENEVGAETFLDPRQDAQRYGYWYVSDGKSYTLYASLEQPRNDESCVAAVEPVASAPNLVCLRSLQ